MYGHRTLAKYAVNCNRLLSSAPVKTEAKGNELSKHCTGVRRAKEDGGDAGRRQRKPATALIVIPGQAEVGSEGWGGRSWGSTGWGDSSPVPRREVLKPALHERSPRFTGTG